MHLNAEFKDCRITLNLFFFFANVEFFAQLKRFSVMEWVANLQKEMNIMKDQNSNGWFWAQFFF